jgi:hypothetical protein
MKILVELHSNIQLHPLGKADSLYSQGHKYALGWICRRERWQGGEGGVEIGEKCGVCDLRPALPIVNIEGRRGRVIDLGRDDESSSSSSDEDEEGTFTFFI